MKVKTLKKRIEKVAIKYGIIFPIGIDAINKEIDKFMKVKKI